MGLRKKKIGNLKTLITIEERQGDVATNRGGSTGGGWIVVASPWCNVIPKRGQRRGDDGRLIVDYEYELMVRYDQALVNQFQAAEELSQQFRILLPNGEYLTIHSVVDVDYNQERYLIRAYSDNFK